METIKNAAGVDIPVYHEFKNGQGATVKAMNPAFFLECAKALSVKIGNTDLTMDPKEFGTGSVGYYGNGKVELEVGGVVARFQVGLNITLIGSKKA